MQFLSKVSCVSLLALLFVSSCSNKSSFATVNARTGASNQDSPAVGSAGKPEGADVVETGRSAKASEPTPGEAVTAPTVPDSAGEVISSFPETSVAGESVMLPGSGVEMASKPLKPVENGGVPSGSMPQPDGKIDAEKGEAAVDCCTTPGAEPLPLPTASVSPAPAPSVSFKIAVDQLKNNAGYNNCLEVSVNGAPLQKVACTKDDLSEVKTVVFPAKAWPACNVIRLSYTSYGYGGQKLYTRSTENAQMTKDYMRVAARKSDEFQLNYEDLVKTDPSIDWDFNDYVASFKIESQLNLSVENSDQLVCQPE
jgi:hypothetical protein